MSHEGHICGGHQSAPSVTQTLDEMDFERGIWSAALNGENEVLKSKLISGDDPNTIDSSGYTALHYAARNGHYDCCETLLSYGAGVNAQTRSGRVTPLHRSSYSGHRDITRLLVTRGADVTLADNDGKTALHKAAERNHEEIAGFLIQKSSTILKTKDNKGKLAKDYGLFDFLSNKSES